jgi:hypothetical protein
MFRHIWSSSWNVSIVDVKHQSIPLRLCQKTNIFSIFYSENVYCKFQHFTVSQLKQIYFRIRFWNYSGSVTAYLFIHLFIYLYVQIWQDILREVNNVIYLFCCICLDSGENINITKVNFINGKQLTSGRGATVTEAVYQYENMVFCDIPTSRKRRSPDNSVDGYDVSLSYDGTNYGDSVSFIIYDEDCFTWANHVFCNIPR